MMTWGAKPMDLNTVVVHKFSPDEVMNSSGKSVSASGLARLTPNKANLTGYGVKSATITEKDEKYHIFMENQSTTDSLSSSYARMTVFQGCSYINDFIVPSSGNGKYWHVCNLDQNGVFEVNKIKDSMEGDGGYNLINPNRIAVAGR